MGKYDGILHEEYDKNVAKYSPSDFHFINNMLYINKNLKSILHRSQYSDTFTIAADKLDLDKNKIIINSKWIVKIDPTIGIFKGTIMVDNDDKLQ